jgi:hypothetical protein
MANSIGAPGFKPWQQWPRAGSQWPKYNLESDQAEGLVGFWSCFAHEPGWGLLRDVLGKYHMTAYNSPTIAGSEFGPVVNFDDGDSEYLHYSGVPVSAVPLTLAAWVNFDDLNTGTECIISIGDNDASDRFRLIFAEFWNIGANTNGNTAWTSVGPSINTWHNGVAVFSASDSRIAYLDGGNSGSESTDVSPTVDRTTIGAMYNDTQGDNISDELSGKIAEVRIYNRALSDAEVAALYDPKTRWELYQIPKRVWYVAAAPAADAMPMAVSSYRRRRI